MTAKSSLALFKVALIIGSGILGACSSSVVSNNSLMARLKNRGPVALSPNNPYLAPNLLLAKEMERSPELKGFIEHSGQPSALQIDDGMLSSASMRLYYTSTNKYFVLEDFDGTWLINGPYDASTNELAGVPGASSAAGQTVHEDTNQGGSPQISTTKIDDTQSDTSPETAQPAPIEMVQAEQHGIVPFRSMASAVPTPTFAPPFETKPPKPPKHEKESRTPTTKSTRATSAPTMAPTPAESSAEHTADPTIDPAAQPTLAAKPSLGNPSTSPRSESLEGPGSPRPSTVLGELVDPIHPAELAPNGDLVHHVTFPGETLSMISRWYTADRNNAGKIARMNKIANPESLSIGDTVVIPGYLLKNKNRLTENGVKELGAKAAELRKK